MSGETTDNAQEIPNETASGTILAWDEVTKWSADKQQSSFYKNQSRAGRARAKRDGSAQHRRKWGAMTIMFSAEVGYVQRLQQEKGTKLGGVAARALAIKTSVSTRLGDEGFAKVETTIRDNFGLSGAVMVQAMSDLGYVKDRSRLRKEVKDLVAKLRDTTGPENVQRKRAARLIAYPWLAAKIAQKIRLIPADFDVDALMKKMWEDTLKSDMAPVEAAVTAADAILSALVANKGGSIVSFKYRTTSSKEHFGYFDVPIPGNIKYDGIDKDEHKLYVVRVDKLGDLGGDGADKKSILRELERRGLLIRNPHTPDSRTWSGFPGLSKGDQYVVLKAVEIDEAEAVA